MSNEAQWLERLNTSTNYRDLQAVFSQMAAAAHHSSNAMELAGSIDEAIRRIEQERIRDHSGLDESTNEYEAFKKEQSGVVGWFKRKMPFTATRKQELSHREAVNEQEAEILADNFVIARAQILKENILPSSGRRMGGRIGEWRQKLQQHESTLGIREYGNALSGLGADISQGQTFAANVGDDIESFAKANFADKQDANSRDHDLMAARAEVKAITDEIAEKLALRKSGLRRIGQLIVEEYSSNDPTFRSLVHRGTALQHVLKSMKELRKTHEEYRELLKTICLKLAELETLPEQRAKLESTLRELRSQSQDTELKRTRAANDHQQPFSLYENAKRDVEQSSVALKASKSLYDAYLAEQNKAEVASAADFQTNSPVVAEYERLKNVAAQAEEALRRATPSFEATKRQLDEATKNADELQKKINETSKTILGLSDSENRIRSEVNKARSDLAPIESNYDRELSAYAQDLRLVAELDGAPRLSGVPAELLKTPSTTGGVFPPISHWPNPSVPHTHASELRSFQHRSEQAERFAKLLSADKDLLEKEIVRQATARKDALVRHATLLVDSNLANEIDFD
jgi:hypothetical protein